jgi:pyridoxine 4-dehydrogenase
MSERRAETVLQVCERDGLAFLPWYPLSGGRDATRTDRVLSAIAARHGATPAQIAIAWLLARSPVMLPIPGTSSVHHLEENVAAAGMVLTPDERAELA